MILHDKCEAFEKIIQIREAEIKKLQFQISQLFDVLWFYQDKNNWNEREGYGYPRILDDEGEKAKEILIKYGHKIE
jgi:phage/plasmid-associated DNA primase